METAIVLDADLIGRVNDKNRLMTFSQHLVAPRANNTGVSTRNVTGRQRQVAPGGRNAQIERQRLRIMAQGRLRENALLPRLPHNRLLTPPAPAPNLGARFREPPLHDVVRGYFRQVSRRNWENDGHVSGQRRIEEPDDG